MRKTKREIEERIQQKYKWHKYKVVKKHRVIKAWQLIDAINELTERLDKKILHNRPMWKTYAYIQMGFCKGRRFKNVTAESMFGERPKRDNINKVIRNAQRVMERIIELQQVKEDFKYILERTTIRGAREIFGFRQLDAGRYKTDGVIGQMKPSTLESVKKRVEYYKDIVPRNFRASEFYIRERTTNYKMTSRQKSRKMRPLTIKIYTKRT